MLKYASKFYSVSLDIHSEYNSCTLVWRTEMIYTITLESNGLIIYQYTLAAEAKQW